MRRNAGAFVREEGAGTLSLPAEETDTPRFVTEDVDEESAVGKRDVLWRVRDERGLCLWV